MPVLLPCPKCGYTRAWKLRRSARRCKQCRKEWVPHPHALLPGYACTNEEWRSICDAFLVHGTILAAARTCSLAYATSQKAVLLLRAMMALDIPSLLTGTCEVDETYIGGAWRNKAIHIRKRGTKRGRGTQKQAIFGIVSRNLRQVRTWLVPNTKRETLFPIIEETIPRGSTIYTDGASVYRALPSLGYHHDWVDHDADEYVREGVHTQTIDGFWGYLKNRLAKTGGMQKERAHLFVGEHQWRYNHRKLTHEERVARLLERIRFGGWD